MDRFVATFLGVPDGDLMLCHKDGLAYQSDMRAAPVPYDEGYFDHYAQIEGKTIARKINAGRVGLVNRGAGAQCEVLDVGIGCGEFIKNRANTFGFDVNPKAKIWLRERKLWRDDFTAFRAFTFWDVLEHIEDPQIYFRYMVPGSFLFTSLPIFSDLSKVRQSKHYKPGEHLYYWTEAGFVAWMGLHGFVLQERSDCETIAGRENILSFAFRLV